MSDVNVAPGGGAEAIVSVPVATPAAIDNSPISATEAARQLSNYRWKRDNPEAAKAEEATPAPVEAAAEDLPETAESDPPQEAPAEQTQEAEPALPPIEPPRSWTSELKERWNALPREAQEEIQRVEQGREREFRRSQNEAAEERKAIQAERAKVEQARQQYEATLPQLLQTLQEQQAGPFADIKTMADVERLSTEDPFRYIQWTAHQHKVSAAQNELKAAQERQATEWNEKWTQFATSEDAKVIERIPELADPKQRAKIQEGALSYLKDSGFADSDLGQLWNGQASLSLRDHRLQGIIRDAVKYREAKASVAKPAPKPVPPVQRPGTPQPAISTADAEIQALAKRFERTGSLRDAQALRVAQTRAK